MAWQMAKMFIWLIRPLLDFPVCFMSKYAPGYMLQAQGKAGLEAGLLQMSHFQRMMQCGQRPVNCFTINGH